MKKFNVRITLTASVDLEGDNKLEVEEKTSWAINELLAGFDNAYVLNQTIEAIEAPKNAS